MGGTLKRVSINFEDYTSEASMVYAGRERGEAAREAAKLSMLDDLPDTIVDVQIPKDIFVVTSSFFRGMFAPSIQKLGADGFRRKYQFHGWDVSLVKEEAILRALSAPTVLYETPSP